MPNLYLKVPCSTLNKVNSFVNQKVQRDKGTERVLVFLCALYAFAPFCLYQALAFMCKNSSSLEKK